MNIKKRIADLEKLAAPDSVVILEIAGEKTFQADDETYPIEDLEKVIQNYKAQGYGEEHLIHIRVAFV